MRIYDLNRPLIVRRKYRKPARQFDDAIVQFERVDVLPGNVRPSVAGTDGSREVGGPLPVSCRRRRSLVIRRC